MPMLDVDEEFDQPMVDALKARARWVIQTSIPNAAQLAAHHLSTVWPISDRVRNGTAFCLKVTVPVRAGLLAEAKVKIWLPPIQGGLSVRFDMHTNGHSIVRQRYKIAGSVKGAGGATNFALPSAEYTVDDLQLQFDAIAAIATAIRDAIGAPFPDAVIHDDQFKIVSAELCLDIPCDDPQAALRMDRLVPQAGTKTVTHAVFVESSESGRKLCNKERTRTNGVELRAYEKWFKHVRVEAQAPNVTAVGELLPPGVRNDAPLTPEGIRELLIAFYNAAGQLCCSRKDHFVRASAAQGDIVDLIIALQPLMRIVMREPLDGGYRPREEAAQAARKLLVDLLTSGLTHAVGLPKGTQVRQVLEGLAVPGGPLARKDHTTIFCLSPDYAYAVPSVKDQI